MFVVELSPSSANVGSVTSLLPILNPSVAAKDGTPLSALFAVAVSLMVSPSFARSGSELFDAIVTVVNSVAVASTLTEELSVVLITASETLPIASLAVKEKLTSPLSPDFTM